MQKIFTAFDSRTSICKAQIATYSNRIGRRALVQFLILRYQNHTSNLKTTTHNLS